MNRALQTALLALVLCFPNLSHAQDDGAIIQPSVARKEVHIVNRANRALKFDLRPNEGRWTTYEIGSGDAQTFRCPRCDEFEFVMKSDGRQVHYTLKSKRRYYLEWNPQRQLWDLFRIQPEDQ